MGYEGIGNPARLFVEDKRILFQSLLGMTERLLFLNRFPVDQREFALSLLPPDQEAAYRLLEEEFPSTVVSAPKFFFEHLDTPMVLHRYPDEENAQYAHELAVFPRQNNQQPFLTADNRFFKKVDRWVKNQIRLEEQIIKTMYTIKAIVHSCNTVGQYKRVSPELVTFLPDKYKQALKDYTKKSPYPAITVEPSDIEAAIANLAFASLQPETTAEQSYKRYLNGRSVYRLGQFARTKRYESSNSRRHNL